MLTSVEPRACACIALRIRRTPPNIDVARWSTRRPPCQAGPCWLTISSPPRADTPSTHLVQGATLVIKPSLRSWLFSWVLVAATCGVAAAQSGPPEFRWAGDPEGGAPYVEESTTDPNSLVGFDVEIADLIGRGLERSPKFVFEIGRAHV